MSGNMLVLDDMCISSFWKQRHSFTQVKFANPAPWHEQLTSCTPVLKGQKASLGLFLVAHKKKLIPCDIKTFQHVLNMLIAFKHRRIKLSICFRFLAILPLVCNSWKLFHPSYYEVSSFLDKGTLSTRQIGGREKQNCVKCLTFHHSSTKLKIFGKLPRFSKATNVL